MKVKKKVYCPRTQHNLLDLGSVSRKPRKSFRAFRETGLWARTRASRPPEARALAMIPPPPFLKELFYYM